MLHDPAGSAAPGRVPLIAGRGRVGHWVRMDDAPYLTQHCDEGKENFRPETTLDADYGERPGPLSPRDDD